MGHRIASWLVYLAVRLAVSLAQALPPDLAWGLAQGLGWLAYRTDRRHRRVAEDNLRHALHVPEHELPGLIRAVYTHFALVLVEMVHLYRRLHLSTWHRYIELEDARRLVQELLQPGPRLLLTAHFGNWEVASYVLGLLGFRSYAVARPLDNVYLDRFLRRFRERTGQKLLAKKGELERLERLLGAGAMVCMLADQDAGSRGLYVDFFGRPASTHKSPALLSLHTGARILVLGAWRVRPWRFRVALVDTIVPQPSDTARSLTERFTRAFEKLIRRDITQYFWLHRRWKHQPKRRNAA